MVKTETILCDVCKMKVGHVKCNLCEKDLCDSCRKKVAFSLTGHYPDGSGTFGYYNIYFCGDCHKKMIDNTSSNNPLIESEFLSKLSNKIVYYIKKKLILKNLEDKPIRKDGKEK